MTYPTRATPRAAVATETIDILPAEGNEASDSDFSPGFPPEPSFPPAPPFPLEPPSSPAPPMPPIPPPILLLLPPIPPDPAVGVDEVPEPGGNAEPPLLLEGSPPCIVDPPPEEVDPPPVIGVEPGLPDEGIVPEACSALALLLPFFPASRVSK